MSLAVYAQAAEPCVIRLWVGLFDTEQPPPLAFRIDGQPATPLGASALTPIRDRTTGHSGLPANHRLRAEALAAEGKRKDPDGLISDQLIADTAARLKGSAASNADDAANTQSKGGEG